MMAGRSDFKPCTEPNKKIRGADIRHRDEGERIIPCTEGGEHCFCSSLPTVHALPNHDDVVCCHCGDEKCVSLYKQPVSGHGPHRTELVRE